MMASHVRADCSADQMLCRQLVELDARLLQCLVASGYRASRHRPLCVCLDRSLVQASFSSPGM